MPVGGTTGDDRAVIGQIADIVLTAGVSESRTVTHAHVTFPGPHSEHGAYSRTNVPGLSIKATYFDFALHPPNEWAGLDGAHGSVNGIPTIRSPLKLELIFDGSAPAGTIGEVEVAQTNGELAVMRLIGNINVYVIAPGGQVPVTWFTVISDTASINGNRLILDNPLLNGNPRNYIFVTHSIDPADAPNSTRWPHPISVAYDAALACWTIRNDDDVAMPAGIGFNVRIDPGAKRLSVRRRRGAPAISLTINDSIANKNPFATIFVTPASPNAHPIAVRYAGSYWRIVKADGAPFHAGEKFHVRVFGATAYRDDRWRGTVEHDPLGTNQLSNCVGIDIHGIGDSRTRDDFRHLDFHWTRGRFLPLIITANQTPAGSDLFVDADYSGVSFSEVESTVIRWAVRHENGSAMGNHSSFNIWGPYAHPPLEQPVNFSNTVRRDR